MRHLATLVLLLHCSMLLLLPPELSVQEVHAQPHCTHYLARCHLLHACEQKEHIGTSTRLPFVQTMRLMRSHPGPQQQSDSVQSCKACNQALRPLLAVNLMQVEHTLASSLSSS